MDSARLVGALALAATVLVSGWAQGACLALAGHPDGAPLSRFAVPDDDAVFVISYVHSVTRTPVTERYHIAGSDIVETEMRFEQHGPGLPTEADAGGTFTRDGGRFVVTMDRHFPAIVMQVHRDQSPRLVHASHTLDLAQWGNRALRLGAMPGPCVAP